jgi:ribonuclease Z
LPELILLGTAASVPDAEHDTIGMLLRGPDWAILIDCGGSPLHKLARSGVALEAIRAIVLTHRHADHIYGLPMLVQSLWIGGRKAPLPVFGPAETLDLARELLELFNLAEREGMFALDWRPVPLNQRQPVTRVGEVRITAAPMNHDQVQTLGLRFENTMTGHSIVYSADTEPNSALIDLASGADLLIHEATGEYSGHSSPEQAATVARKAGVAQLVLIHFPVHNTNLEAWRRAAVGFAGPVSLARDGDVYPL